MGIFRKKHDPISERARALSSEIASLEARIKELNSQNESGPAPRQNPKNPFPQPRKRESSGGEPIFERVDQNRIKEQPQAAAPHQVNELGLRKYDLLGMLNRLRKHFYGPPVSNPRLVNYLAAGSVQGLRSLRFEKRVARNRFIAWTLILAVILFGTLAAWMRRH